MARHSTQTVPESSAPAIARTAIDLRSLPWVSRLAAAYAHDFAPLAPFYAGNPADDAAWTDAIARTQAFGRDRDGIVAVLEKQLARRGAPPAAVANVARLRDPKTVAIVTGQQAGVFGGPLYTLLKSLTAIDVARRLEARTGTPVVPIFWIDSEDHDWDEVATTTILDADHQPLSVTVARPERAGEVSVAQLALDGRAAAAIETVRDALPPTEFTAEVIETLRAGYADGRSMSEAFGCLLESWLGAMGLVVYDCSCKNAKPLAAQIFAHELAHPGRTAALAGEAGQRLAALGFHAQVSTHADGVALFSLDRGRHAIRWHDGAFEIDGARIEQAALVERARTQPELFSPNVLLRPLVQDTLFPTVCYIGGPAELAYQGQLREVYAHFGIPMPLVLPRTTATVLDPPATRFFAKYSLSWLALQAQDEHALNELLESQLPPEVEASLHAASEAMSERMQRVIAAVPAIDPTLEGAARSTLGRMEHDLKTLHNKIIQAAKKRDETLRRQFVRTRALVFPDGHLQERTLGAIVFLNKYGPAFIDGLASDLPRDAGTHWLLTL